MSLIQIENVSFVYNSKHFAPVKAINNLSLNFDKGRSYAVTGESGSGKSTLLNLIAGLLMPEEGSINVLNKKMELLNDKQLCSLRSEHMGIVVQEYALLENCTVLENCIISGVLAGKSKKEAKEIAKTKLKKTGILNLIKKPVKELSGGQRQRCAIARAVMNDPAIILADEPTAALDSENSNAVTELLLSLVKEGSTLIMATHSQHLASRCDEIFTLKDGSLC